MKAAHARSKPAHGRRKPRGLDMARELLAAVLRFDQPADAVVSRFFRAHAQLGQRDRHVLAETTYQIVRNLRLYRHLAQGDAGPQDLHLLALGWQGDPAHLAAAVTPELLAWRDRVAGIDPATLPAEVRLSLPDWLFEALRARGDLSDAELDALGQALLRPAPLDLRVNVLKATREQARDALAELGVQAEATALSPWGLRVQGKPALQRMAPFDTGMVEVQDEGSQLLALLLAPRRGEMVADFCAGAGGKTLALGAMMRSTGRLYAFDVAERRLARLQPRLARSGLSNVHPVVITHERDDRVRRLAGKLDRVLVDAPCTGTGTLRRNPDLKWRLQPADLDALPRQQLAILTAAATLLKPGGRLVYATCSLLPAENRAVVEAFLAAHPQFERLDATALLAQQQVALPPDAGGDMLQLWPHRHGTDGFFAAALQRRA